MASPPPPPLIMERKRDGYGFTNEEKQYARNRANGKCEIFYPDCQRPNTNRVNHITGCFEGKLMGMPKETVSDIKQNSAMLCSLHEQQHDFQEQEHVDKFQDRQFKKIWFTPFDVGITVWRNRKRK